MFASANRPTALATCIRAFAKNEIEQSVRPQKFMQQHARQPRKVCYKLEIFPSEAPCGIENSIEFQDKLSNYDIYTFFMYQKYY